MTDQMIIKFAGFFALTTLTFQTIQGKNLLLMNIDKDNELKAPEKRASSIRMNVETPFDPNFWPTRGRRGKKDPEKPNEDCFPTDEYFGLQCQQGVKRSDLDVVSNDPESGVFTNGVRTGGDCYGNPLELKAEGVKRKLRSEGTDSKIPQRFNQFIANRRRRQRMLPLSRFLANGNEFYYEPDDPFVEKMKKQDVFWVVRGKRNFQ